MWGIDKRETDLTRLLKTPTLAAKVSKFLLTTNELMKFRHLNESQADVDNDDSKKALGKTADSQKQSTLKDVRTITHTVNSRGGRAIA